MIAFLTIIYAALAYLVFFQFKLLPFDLKNKIALRRPAGSAQFPLCRIRL